MRTLLQPQSLLMKIDKLIIGATIADSSLELTSSSFYPPFSDAYSERCQTSKAGPSELWGRRCICSPITFSHVIKVSFFLLTKVDDERFCWKKSFKYLIFLLVILSNILATPDPTWWIYSTPCGPMLFALGENY